MDRVPTFNNPRERAEAKQASRDADAKALADGTKTVEDLRRENVRFTPPKRLSFRGRPLPR